MGRARGIVTAFDAETGEEAWTFHIVPGNPADGFESEAMAMAAETWPGRWWEHGGGGNAWHGLTYDPEYNAVYAMINWRPCATLFVPSRIVTLPQANSTVHRGPTSAIQNAICDTAEKLLVALCSESPGSSRST